MMTIWTLIWLIELNLLVMYLPFQLISSIQSNSRTNLVEYLLRIDSFAKWKDEIKFSVRLARFMSQVIGPLMGSIQFIIPRHLNRTITNAICVSVFRYSPLVMFLIDCSLNWYILATLVQRTACVMINFGARVYLNGLYPLQLDHFD